MLKFAFGLMSLLALGNAMQGQSLNSGTKSLNERSAFQTGSPWIPEIDARPDIAIVYGSDDRKGMTFKERVQSWRDHGYQTHFMTGIAWGGYSDYFSGKWDGINHLGVGQVKMNGDTIWHGKNTPYIVPEKSFIEYFKSEVIRKVIDAGITSIFLEEPEFWAKAGYSAVFRKEWQHYYGFPWRAQDKSPENTYLSNKLKYQLFFNAIREVSAFAKEYGKSKGLAVKVYIPTHSLVNYSSWEIISPEASLASLPGIDGYIAQVWTGTSREPIYYNGLKKERVFENAFLEYGSMVSMTAPTGRKLFFLTDPVEDRPRDWSDFKNNYQATFTAQLLYPMVNNYEVMPWPERIYTHPYQIANRKEPVLIPNYYSTQMQVMTNALNDMPLSATKISGSSGIGVLMCNSMMFQRFPSHDSYEDPQFSNFYGQVMPLLKMGIPVQIVHLENLSFQESLKHMKVLILSYSNMKPMNPEVHHYLADWILKGGVLIYCGRDDDPYQSVMEWWNTSGNTFKSPDEHLFKFLGIQIRSGLSKSTAGKGRVYFLAKNPKEFVIESKGGNELLNITREAFETDAGGGKLELKNNFYLERGPYDIAAVMDESVTRNPLVINGPVIDLFDPQLPVLTHKTVNPGEQAFLYDPERVPDKSKPQVLASASRIYDEEFGRKSYSFVSKGPLKTINVMRILLPGKPGTITIKDSNNNEVPVMKISWDKLSGTCFLSCANQPNGIKVFISWH